MHKTGFLKVICVCGQGGYESLNLLFPSLARVLGHLSKSVCVCVCVCTRTRICTCVLYTFETPEVIEEVLQKPNRLVLQPISISDRGIGITKIYYIQYSVSY